MNKGKIWLAVCIIFMLVVGVGSNASAKVLWGKKGKNTQVTDSKKAKEDVKKDKKKTHKKHSKKTK